MDSDVFILSGINFNSIGDGIGFAFIVKAGLCPTGFLLISGESVSYDELGRIRELFKREKGNSGGDLEIFISVSVTV